MSKSLGNVADPYAILQQLQAKGLSKEQATDALRYYLLREISTFEDGDYTWEKFVESYNANLANGIGNLTSRILKMAQMLDLEDWILDERGLPRGDNWIKGYDKYMGKFNLKGAMDDIWEIIKHCDLIIQNNQPFKKIKEAATKEEAENDIKSVLLDLYIIGKLLKPVLPYTAEKILQALKEPSLESIPRLFPRIE